MNENKNIDNQSNLTTQRSATAEEGAMPARRAGQVEAEAGSVPDVAVRCIAWLGDLWRDWKKILCVSGGLFLTAFLSFGIYAWLWYGIDSYIFRLWVVVDYGIGYVGAGIVLCSLWRLHKSLAANNTRWNAEYDRDYGESRNDKS
jgi:hypothetical protein